MAEQDQPDLTRAAVVPSQHGSPSEAMEPAPASRGEVTGVSRGTGVSVALVVGLVLAILATVIAVQNTRQVTVKFLAWEAGVPLVAVILTAGIAGVVLDEVLGLFWRRRQRRALAERLELQRLRGD